MTRRIESEISGACPVPAPGDEERGAAIWAAICAAPDPGPTVADLSSAARRFRGALPRLDPRRYDELTLVIWRGMERARRAAWSPTARRRAIAAQDELRYAFECVVGAAALGHARPYTIAPWRWRRDYLIYRVGVDGPEQVGSGLHWTDDLGTDRTDPPANLIGDVWIWSAESIEHVHGRPVTDRVARGPAWDLVSADDAAQIEAADWTIPAELQLDRPADLPTVRYERPGGTAIVSR